MKRAIREQIMAAAVRGLEGRRLQAAQSSKQRDEEKMRHARAVRARKNAGRDALSAWEAHKGRSRVSPGLVRAIRADYAAGNSTREELACAYDVSVSCIGHLLTGKTWAWVEGEIQEPRASVRLAPSQVREMRAECAGARPSREQVDAFQLRYGAARESIWEALTGLRWAWVEGPVVGMRRK